MNIISKLENLLNEFTDKPSHISDKTITNLPRFIVKVNAANRHVDKILYTLIPSKAVRSTKEAIALLLDRAKNIVSLHEDAEFEVHIFDKDVIKQHGGEAYLSSHVITIKNQKEEN